jgi:hypothetical protein
VPAYAGLAYVVVPAAWSRYERSLPERGALGVSYTAERIPADPLNVALVGTRGEIVAAMRAAGWAEADGITFASSVRDAGSVFLDRAYPSAPVSTHYLWNRPQDLAFEQTVGRSARRRHHVRFWQTRARDGGRPVWIGATTYDRSVGLSRFTGELMHHIDGLVDEEREKLFSDLGRALRLESSERIGRFRPAGCGVNGGGDPYQTDGALLFGRLRRG